MIVDEMKVDIAENRRRIMNICRIGQVAVVDPMTAKVDVTFEEGLTVQGIPFLTMRAGEDQTYWLPSVGELGVMFCPSGDIANALFLPAIFYTDFPASDAMSTTVAKRIFRGDDPHVEEEVDTDANSYKLSSGDSDRFIDSDKVEDKHTADNVNKIDASETKLSRSAGSIKIDGSETKLERSTNSIKIDGSETTLERAAGAIKALVGANTLEVSAILANILGAQIFASGVTTFMTAMGPAFFAPAPSPPSPPAPPAGSNPDADGNATQVPETTKANLSITAGTINFTIPSLTVTVTGTAGPYPIVATASSVPTPAQLNFTGNGITLVIPPEPL